MLLRYPLQGIFGRLVGTFVLFTSKIYLGELGVVYGFGMRSNSKCILVVQTTIHRNNHFEFGNALAWLVSSFRLVLLHDSLEFHSVHRESLAHGIELTDELFSEDCALL